MLACHSCWDLPQCASVASVHHERGLPRIYCDPVWNSIQAEALVEADREPLLRPLMEQSVLKRHSIGDALAMVLSQRLGGGPIDSSKLYDEFRKIIGEQDAIAESARCDLSAIRKNDPATESLLHPFMNFKGFLAVQAYRISHALWTAGRRTLACHLQSRTSDVFAVDIHPAAIIGSGVFMDHGTGIVIGETAVIGDNVTILHGVTLGGTGKESGDRHPKVASGVLIGAGAQLLGNIQIGENARIAASSVVLRAVEAGTTVAGIPAKIVRRPDRPTIPLGVLDSEVA